jgi:2-methylcitrate dehydratase PrpD
MQDEFFSERRKIHDFTDISVLSEITQRSDGSSAIPLPERSARAAKRADRPISGSPREQTCTSAHQLDRYRLIFVWIFRSETDHALGIAASLASGLVENLPTAAKNAGVGNAARSGMLAAMLAQAGEHASLTAIEGPLGWARASGDAPDIPAMIGGLGTRFEFGRNTFKPYPSGIVMHGVIDACLDLRAAHNLTAADIAAVTVAGNALLLARGDRVVANARDARVSIHHCAAVALLFGTAGVNEFSQPMVFAPDLVAVRAKVTAERDGAIPVGAARITIDCNDGRRLSAEVTDPRGSLKRPLRDADIEAKLRNCARDGSPECNSEAVIEAVWRLNREPSLGRLVEAMSG